MHSLAAAPLSRKEQAKPLRVRALVMTINSSLPPQIHEARLEALKKENVKDENYMVYGKSLRIVLMELFALGGGVGYHIFTNGPIWKQTSPPRKPIGNGETVSHGFYHKTTKENKQYDTTWVIVIIKKNYADVRHKPLEFQVGDKAMLKVSPWKISDTF
ncbi:hypothetical protein Tco_1017898 [Tanacetum coccineum]|uniref:Uncharacterized protein n=1 Tax=Tanacetum coccineum TaxID=301880 RepID=A0ABQ5FSS7_9ASTR